MFGFIIGFGRAAKAINQEMLPDLWPGNKNYEHRTFGDKISLALYAPPGMAPSELTAKSNDESIFLGLDGYVISDKLLKGLKPNLKVIANRFSEAGLANGLDKLVAGSFLLVAVNTKDNTCMVYNDTAGSIPLYYSKLDDGWLLASNPVLLARTGLVDLTPDDVAVAEWALFSYALKERYPVKGIRVARMGDRFEWDGNAGKVEQYYRIWDWTPFEKNPHVDEIAEQFIESCKHISLLDENPANLQSGGMDSRLITASWQAEGVPSCFTYGNPNAHEVSIAKDIAEAKGVSWTHSWQHGDEVAAKLENMFDNTGIIIWPDRYFAAELMAQKGFKGTLDGLAGDALLGGSVYNYDHHFGSNQQLKRLFCQYNHVNHKDIGPDRIASALFQDLMQIIPEITITKYINQDVVDNIYNKKDEILQDIKDDLDYTMPPCDSLAVLWRNFLYANRGPHMTIQQGLMCNQFIQVYYPFTNELAFHELAYKLNPKETVYRKLYVRLYQRHHHAVAKVPYCSTLIPLNRPWWNHKIAAIANSKNISIPYLTGNNKKRPRDPNSWDIWMKESEAMRSYVTDALTTGGIADKATCESYMKDITDGKQSAAGKIFHMVSLAKWRNMAG